MKHKLAVFGKRCQLFGYIWCLHKGEKLHVVVKPQKVAISKICFSYSLRISLLLVFISEWVVLMSGNVPELFVWMLLFLNFSVFMWLQFRRDGDWWYHLDGAFKFTACLVLRSFQLFSVPMQYCPVFRRYEAIKWSFYLMAPMHMLNLVTPFSFITMYKLIDMLTLIIILENKLIE